MINLNTLFNRDTIVKALKELPDLNTPLMDTVYKNKKQHPFIMIGVDELKTTIRNVPIIRRGSSAYKIPSGENTISFIEPQPIEIEDFISAKELNDVETFNAINTNNWTQNKINIFRQSIRATCEALCAQSLNGSISYPMKLEAGNYATYSVDFGNPLEVTTTKKMGRPYYKIIRYIRPFNIYERYNTKEIYFWRDCIG